MIKIIKDKKSMDLPLSGLIILSVADSITTKFNRNLIRIHNHLVRKRTLNHSAKQASLV